MTRLFLLIALCTSVGIARGSEPEQTAQKPIWLSVDATYQGEEIKLAVVFENQVLQLLDNPRRGGVVEQVMIAGKQVPSLVIHNLDTPAQQELANRCRASHFRGTVGMEAIPTRFLVIDNQAHIANCVEVFETLALKRIDVQQLVIDDNGFWCILVRLHGKKFAFQLCSVARMTISILKSLPLSIEEARASTFLGPAFDSSSAQFGPGNAVNIMLTRPEVKLVVIDKEKMEVSYYVQSNVSGSSK